ncbi:hypothetical protein [uncultured Succiniclasticum sp.]|nr:hypothetical protein [uncultured Succiniclasticum sp.]
MILAIFKPVLQASETRANTTKNPFNETRGFDELGIVKYFDSLEN